MDITQEALVAALVAIAVVMVPGAVISWISGLRASWALAASVPVSFAVYGLAGWAMGLFGIPFGVVSVLVTLMLFCLIAFAFRRLLPPTSSLSDAWVLPAVGVIAGALLFLVPSLAWLEETPGGVNNIVQGWDTHWHASVTRHIVDEGMASSTRMGELMNIESASGMFYPVAFHGGAALVSLLTGVSPIGAMNIMTLVAPAVTMPVSLALLAWKMVGGGRLTAQIAAMIAGVSGFLMPVLVWIGQYVGAIPYLVAMSTTGIVAALFMTVPFNRNFALPAALALTGVTQLHPAPVTVVVLLVVLWWLCALLWKPAATRIKDVAVLAITGIVGVALMFPQLLFGSGQAEEVTDWDAQEDVTRAESWQKAMTFDTRHVFEFFPDFNPVILLALAIFGALVLLVWRRNVWALLFWGLSVVLTAHALRPFDVLLTPAYDLLAGLHYSTPHRLVMPVAMVTLAAAAVGLAVMVRLISGGPIPALLTSGSRTTTATKITNALGVVVGLAVTFGVGFYGWNTTSEDARKILKAPRSGNMVTEKDIQAWEWLAEQPHAYDGLIAGTQLDGSGWMYAYNSLPSLYRHYQTPAGEGFLHTENLHWHADLLGVSESVDNSAEQLDVYYFVLSPWNFFWEQIPAWEQLYGLWTAPGATPVYQDGRIVIFAVTDRFEASELEQMRKDSPVPLPPINDPASAEETSGLS